MLETWRLHSGMWLESHWAQTKAFLMSSRTFWKTGFSLKENFLKIKEKCQAMTKNIILGKKMHESHQVNKDRTAHQALCKVVDMYHLIYILTYNLMRPALLLSPFYRKGNWGLAKLSDWLKVTGLISQDSNPNHSTPQARAITYCTASPTLTCKTHLGVLWRYRFWFRRSGGGA